jgi:uncharacterized protein (TIRG00374 family)
MGLKFSELSSNPNPTQSRLIKRSMWVSYILFVGGIALLVWLIIRLGPREILNYLHLLGWNFIPFFSVSLITAIFFTEAWNAFLRGIGLKIQFGRLFMIKAAGEAVNTVTPFGWGGGDPIRIYLLKRSIPIAEGAASVVVDRTLNSIALVLFMLIGILIAFVKFDLPFILKIGFPVSLAFMIGMTLYWYRRQHEGIFAFLVEILIRLRIKKNWSFETLQKLKEIDQLITQFYTQNRLGFFIAFLLQFVVRLLGVVEVYLASYFLGLPLSWIACYLLMSVTVILNMIFVFVPGTVGVLEGAYAGIFHLIHQNPAIGTSIQILRRIRMIIWSAIGLYYIYHHDRRTRIELKELAFEHHPLNQMEVPASSKQDLS